MILPLVTIALMVAPPLQDREVPGSPRLERAAAEFDLRGPLGSYLQAVGRNWLETLPAANPGVLEMLRDRDRRPPRPLEPWAGEFAGKYVTGAVQVIRLTRDPALKAVLADFVAEWIATQDDDGYLGPWATPHRLTGQAPNVGGQGVPGGTWDAWGHYHAMLGLLLWHEETGDESALAAARKIGDLLCRRFLGDKRPRLVDTGSTEMNLAPAHGLVLLHRKTRDPKYLALARQIVDEFAAKDDEGRPLAGDYLQAGLAGTEFFATPRPRWESLHPILALAELHAITGNSSYRKAFENLWWSIAKLDRHNNGGFSSGEQAQGNPYDPRPIETCCTIAWMAMSVEMLRLTGDPIVADELELSTLNSALGLHSPSGRWATYNTPMDGVRKASAHDIVFQAREGTPELNCCSVNAARGLGLVSDWALMRDADDLILNWYGPGTMRVRQPSGALVTLRQETDYPRDGRVRIVVEPEASATFRLKLRIPHWSTRTTVAINGEAQPATPAGRYLTITKAWSPGDRIDLGFDFRPHFWAGEREAAGKVSAYRGPVLLAWDRRHNAMDPDDLPAIGAGTLPGKLVDWSGPSKPILLLEVTAEDDRVVRLCDFASAGQAGSPYRSWLPITGVAPVAFDRDRPFRSTRPD